MKKTIGDSQRTRTLTNQHIYFKFLISLGWAVLLYSLYSKGEIVWAHAYPAVSIPNNDATVKEPPQEVRIQFTEGVEIAFSRITVKGANGEVVSQGKLRQLAGDTLAIDLKPLSPGNYTVEWQVLSVDTHVTEGLLRFTIVAAGK
jgi:methionine-rich copper-binding protein CopC